MRRFFFGLAILAVAFAVPGWANADDQQIAQQIAQQLRIEKDQGNLKGFGIDLQVDQGTVWMKGEVSSAEQRSEAFEIARRTSGVKQVVNDLVVRSDAAPDSQPAAAKPAAATTAPSVTKPAAAPLPPAPAPETRPAIEAQPVAATSNQLRAESGPSDDELASEIMSKLKALKDAGRLKGFSLEVKPKSGQVWMIGRVASDEQRQMVLNAAAHVKGVRQVVNAIRVEEATAGTAGSQNAATRETVVQKPAEKTQAAASSKSKSSRRGLLSGLWSKKDPVEEPQRTQTPRVASRPSTDSASKRVTKATVSAEPEVASGPTSKSAQVSSRKPVAPVVSNAAPKTSARKVQLVNNEQTEAAPATAAPQQVQVTSVLQRTQDAVGSGVAPQPVVAAGPVANPMAPQAQQMMVYQPVRHYAPVAFAPSQIGQSQAYAGQAAGPQVMPASQQMGGSAMGGVPVPMHSAGPAYGASPVRYDHPNMPGYAWPSYAAYPNYAAVTYPQQYSPSAWPYIGPFYPYPQVPLGWRKVTLEWDDGWWMLDFKSK